MPEIDLESPIVRPEGKGALWSPHAPQEETTPNFNNETQFNTPNFDNRWQIHFKKAEPAEQNQAITSLPVDSSSDSSEQDTETTPTAAPALNFTAKVLEASQKPRASSYHSGEKSQQGLALIVNSAHAIINTKQHMKIKNIKQPPSSLGLTLKASVPRKTSMHTKALESQQ